MENQPCIINDDWLFKGMQTVFMENEFLKIGILPGRGSDIFEFRYKDADLDFLLRLSKGITNPNTEFTQRSGTTNAIEDHYYGGWQEMLPNSPPLVYRGASLGKHGEVSLSPWKYSIIENSPECVSLRLWTNTLRLPIRIEKTLTLRAGSKSLEISERLTNESPVSIDIMWGHHIAFGLPFLQSGAAIETSATTFYAEPEMPSPRRFLPGRKFTWPMGVDANGALVNASVVDGESGPQYSDLCYLEGHGEKAYYQIKGKWGIGFRLDWNGDLFKCLWLWEERNATKNFPWWGQCYTLALEPWTSPSTLNPEQAIANEEWLHLNPHEVINTQLTAQVIC